MVYFSLWFGWGRGKKGQREGKKEGGEERGGRGKGREGGRKDEFIMAQEAGHGNRSRRMADHVFITHREQWERTENKARLLTLRAHPQ